MKGATMASSTLLSRGALAAIFVAASLVAPAALAQSQDRGSSVKDPARANVYVPPSPDTARANVYVPPSPDTAARQAERWLEAHPNTQDLPDAHKTANVYVPPSGSYADQVSSLSDEQLAAAYGTAIPAPAATQTLAHAARQSGDDGASPWVVIGLALGCVALLGGAGLALVHRGRRARRSVA
jgi:hypothetical protein